MLTIIYRLIILFISILIVWDMFKEKNTWNQLTCSMVLVPFILRMLMVK
jgi:hypothetical protein